MNPLETMFQTLCTIIPMQTSFCNVFILKHASRKHQHSNPITSSQFISFFGNTLFLTSWNTMTMVSLLLSLMLVLSLLFGSLNSSHGSILNVFWLSLSHISSIPWFQPSLLYSILILLLANEYNIYNNLLIKHWQSQIMGNKAHHV